jgi:uncharacterized membrane protein YjjB (DUF3815 family)
VRCTIPGAYTAVQDQAVALCTVIACCIPTIPSIAVYSTILPLREGSLAHIDYRNVPLFGLGKAELHTTEAQLMDSLQAGFVMVNL